MKLILLVGCGSMLYLGSVGAEHSEAELGTAHTSAAEVSSKPAVLSVPEPATMLFAGLGGLGLLLFVTRRK